MISASLSAHPHQHLSGRDFYMLNYISDWEINEQITSKVVPKIITHIGSLLVNSFRQTSLKLREKMWQVIYWEAFANQPFLEEAWAEVKALLQHFMLLYDQIRLFSRPLLGPFRTILEASTSMSQKVEESDEYSFSLFGRCNLGWLNHRNITVCRFKG